MLGLDIHITVKEGNKTSNFSWEKFEQHFLDMKAEAGNGGNEFTTKLMLTALEAAMFSFGMDMHKKEKEKTQ